MPIGYLMTTEDGYTFENELEPDLTPGVRQEFREHIYLGQVPGASCAFRGQPALDLMTDGVRARLFSVRYEDDDVVADDWLGECSDIAEMDGEDLRMFAVEAFTLVRELPYRRFFGPCGARVALLFDGLDGLLGQDRREIGPRGVEIFRNAFPGAPQEVGDRQDAQDARVKACREGLSLVRKDGAQAAYETGRVLAMEMPYAAGADDGEEWLLEAIEYQWATAAQALALADVIPAELLGEVLAPLGARTNAAGLVDFSPLYGGTHAAAPLSGGPGSGLG
ncbi:MAG: hypothetical protein M0Z91_10020 [Actinomycetota bacterium]|nr:hypothetical protein [Actinomycetota bacterium]